MEYISSIENNTIKKLKKLKIRKYRDEEKSFLAEGKKFLDFNYVPKLILLREDIQDNIEIMEKTNKFNCKKYILSEKVFSLLTNQENSQGVILVYPYVQSSEELKNDILVLDKVQDPGNLGTIIRVADAAGFKDIILTKGSVDCYNEKTVRSTMGSLFRMNILYMETQEVISLLKNKNYKMHVTALAKDSIIYDKMNLIEKNAYIFGSEGNGVSQEFLDNCDEKVIIPIYGDAESLNVSIALGIIIYKVIELKKGV